MNPLNINKLLLFLILIFIFHTTFAANKHALLIGIQDYPQTPFDSLKGPLNDVKLMKDVLQERFGFREDDMTILLNEQATHTQIEQAFITLAKQIRPDDFVYIYYSGHGSQTQDLNGDEPSGQDQTWVSYGARHPDYTGKDNYDVLDDEIAAWLQAFYRKTKQVIFISDSCHSATVSRGRPIGRAVKNDERPHPLGKVSYGRPVKPEGIRIGAARDRESAIETYREEADLYYGIFTWHWANALQQAHIGESWYDVFKRAYTQIIAWHGNTQRPQLEGEGYRQVLGSDFTPVKSTIPVIKVRGTQVTLQAGYLTGVTTGSVYRYYQPQSVEKLPRLTITDVEAFESHAQAESLFQVGDLVEEAEHVYHFDPIKIYLKADYPERQDKPLLQHLKTAFQNPTKSYLLRRFILSENANQADLQLYLLRPQQDKIGQLIRATANDVLPQSFPNQPPELWILTPHGQLLQDNLRILFHDVNKGIQSLQDNLKKWAQIRELKLLASHTLPNTPPVTVQTYIFRPIDTCRSGINCVPLFHGLGLRHKLGPYHLSTLSKQPVSRKDAISFALLNTSQEDYYVYLINITSDGTIQAIFPPSGEREEYALIKAGDSRELSDEVVLVMETVGQEVVKVITTKKPIDISLLEQAGFQRRQGSLNPLERLLVNAMYGYRGSAPVSSEVWYTDMVEIAVR
jgi:hypothetical protein